MKKFYAVLIVFAALFLSFDISFARTPIAPGVTHIDTATVHEGNISHENGAVFYNEGTLITDANFINNRSTESLSSGGAIYAASGSTTTIGDGVKFSSNTAQRFGGAICAYCSSSMTIGSEAVFLSNTANRSGGAICAYPDSSVTIGSGAIFLSNAANEYGGAVLLDSSSTMKIGSEAVFSSNTAGVNGGGIGVWRNTITKIGDGVIFSSNSAKKFGGAIYVFFGSTMTIGNIVNFSSNSAESGGAIASLNSNKIIIGTDSKFSFNESSLNGGAIYNSSNSIITIDTGGKFSYNTATSSGGAIYNMGELTIGDEAVFNSNTSQDRYGGAIYAAYGSTTTIGDQAEFISNKAYWTGGAVWNEGTMTIGNEAKFSSNTAVHWGGAIVNSEGELMIGDEVVFTSNTAGTGGAILNEISIMTIGESALFSSNKAANDGGAIYNEIGELKIKDGALFSGNKASHDGGAIYNCYGTLNLNAAAKNVEFTGNTANGVSNAIYDEEGTINLYTKGADIIFNDRIASYDDTSILNINIDTTSVVSGKVVLNENMREYLGQVKLQAGIVEIGEKGTWFAGETNVENAEISLINNKINEISFSTITINSELRLSVEADLQNEKMDNIKADSFAGTGKIKVKAVNILSDGNKKAMNLVFANDTLKAKVDNSVNEGYSLIYKYKVNYDKNSGIMNFTRSGVNPMSQESGMMNFGIYSVQNEIVKQVFTNMAGGALEKRASLRNNLYVSADTERVFRGNSFKRGVWVSPYIVKDTLDFGDNVKDVENSVYGMLAGVDLVVAADKAVSVYCGYNTGGQKYENITMGQNGYILGASGIILKGKLYVGAAANVIINNNEAKSALGTSETENFGYSLGLKGGYDIAFGNNWTLEPNMILMYSGVSASEYTNAGGYKVEDEGINGLLIQPGVKVKLDLEDGWQPYGLMDISINTGESATKVAGTEAEALKLDPYFECGLGVNKDFANTPWSAYAQLTGKAGSRAGAGVNLGVKYAF